MVVTINNSLNVHKTKKDTASIRVKPSKMEVVIYKLVWWVARDLPPQTCWDYCGQDELADVPCPHLVYSCSCYAPLSHPQHATLTDLDFPYNSTHWAASLQTNQHICFVNWHPFFKVLFSSTDMTVQDCGVTCTACSCNVQAVKSCGSDNCQIAL